MKRKFHTSTCDEMPRGYVEVELYLFFNQKLDGGGWLTPRPGQFSPGMTWYPLCRRLDGSQGRCIYIKVKVKCSRYNLLSGGDPRYTTHLVASHRPGQEEDCLKDGYAGPPPEWEE